MSAYICLCVHRVMCVHIYVHTQTVLFRTKHIWITMNIYIDTQIHAYAYTYMCTTTCICAYVHMYIYIYICICTHTHIHMCTLYIYIYPIHIRTHAYAYAYAYVSVYIYIYACMCMCLSVCVANSVGFLFLVTCDCCVCGSVRPCLCLLLYMRSFRLKPVLVACAFFLRRRGPAHGVATLANEASNTMGRRLGRQTLYLFCLSHPVLTLCMVRKCCQSILKWTVVRMN